ncbi:MAG: response regulator receiver protein [Fibrobacteres bacterium]|nr:response regulator receiver protein [Fibrobacterota bacterium]
MEDLRKWYRGSLPASIDALKAARKSLAKDPGGVESARRIAHSLRSSASAYGFPNLSEAARVLERARPENISVCLDQLLSELIRVSAAMGPADLPGILIIEHDAQMCRLLETILSGSDREVIALGSAGEALAVLEERQFALIVLDLSLPDTDGRNFLVLLRERSATAGVPVIVLSGIGGPQPKTECYALGADAYFEKPLAPEVLKAAVSARLHRSVEHRREARQDALTGLPNRAAFCEAFQRAMAMAARKKEPATLALLDFDLLKRINDHLGHVAGDAALRHAARAFSDALRRSDLLARWGGDEFALLLPSTDLQGARFALEKMFATLATSPFRTQDGRAVPMSFSAGIVSVPADASVERAMAEADRYLYLAKTNGRGRMVSESDHANAPMKKILLAEDDEDVAAIVSDSLHREGFEVVHCRNGAAALRSALAMPCALWILDLKQEAEEGRSLLSDLRAGWRGNRVPVLMIASLGTDQALARGFQLGADDYLVKPFSPYDLMTRVHNLLRK